ncbi:hypothetical protein QUC31_002083 [Theobroma cacao]
MVPKTFSAKTNNLIGLRVPKLSGPLDSCFILLNEISYDVRPTTTLGPVHLSSSERYRAIYSFTSFPSLL